MNNRPMSQISAAASAIAAVLLASILGGAWNYSVAPTIFLASGALGIVGLATGYLARRSGANTMNNVGLWLGLAVIVGVLVLSGTAVVEQA